MNKGIYEFGQTVFGIAVFAGFMVGCLSLGTSEKVSYISFFIGCISGCAEVLVTGMKENKKWMR